MYEGIDTIVLHEKLALEERLSFAWQTAPPPSLVEWAAITEQNTRLLQIVLALDEQPAETVAEHPQAADLARLELKINALLDLVSCLLAQRESRPAPAILRLNARAARWARRASDTDALGTAGVLTVYLHASLAVPLRLTGRVVRADEWIDIEFDGVPDVVDDLLDKLIFRRHRRRIADARAPRGTRSGA